MTEPIKKLTRFTEQELKQRKIGDFIDPEGMYEKSSQFKTKKETYAAEGVLKSYTSLYKSFCVLLIKADIRATDAPDRYASAKCAQLMIDAYLLHRSRGQDAEIPNQVHLYKVNKESEAEESGIELYDAELFEEGGGVSENEMIRWVNKNMRIADIEPVDAPCSDAYGMLLHYRKTEQRQEKFYDTMVPKLLSKEDAKKTNKLEDPGKDTIDLIKRLQAALPESE